MTTSPDAAMQHAVAISNLTKHFGSTKAVDGISFTVATGEIFGFLGPNGAGKTTTIRMMMDFLRPDNGGVTLLGLSATAQGVAARKRIGFMPPVTSLNERWTGHAHIDYARSLRATRDVAAVLSKRLNFDPSKKAKHLSTGNRQKLSLILAFMFQPELVILDEPTTGLDPLLQQTVYELIHETHGRGATIFMSSHNLVEVERTCTRVGILREGKLIAQETMRSLQDKHLYKVQLWFNQEYDIHALMIPNVRVTHRDPHMVLLRYHGDAQPLLNVVASAKPHDVAISHATLEEHFMEFYNHEEHA